jgi:hypothetical protein
MHDAPPRTYCTFCRVSHLPLTLDGCLADAPGKEEPPTEAAPTLVSTCKQCGGWQVVKALRPFICDDCAGLTYHEAPLLRLALREPDSPSHRDCLPGGGSAAFASVVDASVAREDDQQYQRVCVAGAD